MAGFGSRNDPLASFNFIITVENMRAGFAEIGGLPAETDNIDSAEAGDAAIRKVPGTRKFTNISLKRGYTPDGKDLWNWRKRVMEGKTQRLAGTITLLDEARKPARTWEFTEAWPAKWVGPAFNATNNDIAIEELEICVEGLTLQSS